MVPQKLQLRNFMCYGEDLAPLQFDGIRVACLSGQNGAGKSALLDAITWALWGAARAKSDDDLIMLGRDEMEVVFEFILDRQTYRVVRRRKRGKRTTTALEFQAQQPDGSWQQLTADTVGETQRLINRTLHMQYDTFINSAFLLQGRADEFASRKPAERKQVLADILGLDEYEELERRAKAMRDQAIKDLDMVRSYIERLESEIARRPDLEQRLADVEQQAASLEEQITSYDDDARELGERAAYLRNQRDILRTLQAERTQKDTDRQQLEADTNEARARVAEYEALIARQAEIEGNVARLQTAHEELLDMEARAEEHQRLSDEFRDWRTQLQLIERDLRSDQARLQEQLDAIEQQLAQHTTAQAERAKLIEQIDAFAGVRAELERLQAHDEALRAQQAHMRELRTKIDALQSMIALQHKQLIEAQHDQQQKVDDLQAQADTLPTLETELIEVDAERDRLDAVARELADVRAALMQASQREGELKAEYKRIEHEGKDLKEKLKLVEAGEGVCPVCNSDLGAHGVDAIREHYQDLITTLREQITAVRAEQRTTAELITAHRTQIEEREALLVERSQLEARRAELTVRRQHALEAKAALAEAQQALAATTERLQQRRYAAAEQQELAELQAQLDQLGDPDHLQQQLDAVRRSSQQASQRLDEATQIQHRLARLDAELALLERGAAERPSIEQRLADITTKLANGEYGAEERREMERIKAAGQALGYNKEAHAALRQEIELLRQWEREALRLEDAQRNVAREQATLRRDTQRLRDLDQHLLRLSDQIAALEDELTEQQMVEQQLRAAEQRRDALRTRLYAVQNDLGSAAADLRRCEEAERQLIEQQQRASSLAEERSIYEELVQAFGKKGVQAMLIETAIPEIEHEANELLGRMTDGQMRVAFETQRDAKTGNSTIETLDIRISDTLGARDYAMFSGGEAFRVNFAIRIALSKLLARRAGASLKTLIIDEGFGTQDAQGRDRIVEAINAIESEFERILVITHIQELKDMFPAQIEIIKTSDGSRWAIA